MIREGVDPKVSGHFFKAIVHAVLLFWADMWVVTPRLERALNTFQQKLMQQVTRRQPMRQVYGSWGYPPLAVEMAEVGFEEIRTYVDTR